MRDAETARPEVGVPFPGLIAANQWIVRVLFRRVLAPGYVLDDGDNVIVEEKLGSIAHVLVDLVL